MLTLDQRSAKRHHPVSILVFSFVPYLADGNISAYPSTGRNAYLRKLAVKLLCVNYGE
jgi:hypothetical protein